MKNLKIKNNLIVDLTFNFALEILEFCDRLNTMKKFAIANQLTRSGTGIGANVWEAQHAESRADFIHKIKISAKEASETEYWLLLNHHSTKYPDATDLLKAVESIQKILNKIITTSKSGGK